MTDDDDQLSLSDPPSERLKTGPNTRFRARKLRPKYFFIKAPVLSLEMWDVFRLSLNEHGLALVDMNFSAADDDY